MSILVPLGNAAGAHAIHLHESPPLTFIRSPTRQAFRHRARHRLQPRRLSRRPRTPLRRHLPPRPGGQLQGGVLQVKGGRVCWCGVGNIPRRLRCPGLRRRCSHQCHRHSQLQGRRLLGWSDLCRQLRSLGKPSITSSIQKSVLTVHSSLLKSPPRSAPSTQSPSELSHVSSRPSVCRSS